MHIKMNIENVIAAFVEQMLPRFSDPKTVLVMSFELRAEKAKTSYTDSRTVHLMFWRPNNYTKVFWNISPRGWKHYDGYSIWNLECDHDSGWLTDGVDTPFFKLAVEMTKKINYQPGHRINISIKFLQEPKLVKVARLNYERKKQKATVEFAKE